MHLSGIENMGQTTPNRTWIVPGWALAIGGLVLFLVLLASYILFWPRHVENKNQQTAAPHMTPSPQATHTWVPDATPPVPAATPPSAPPPAPIEMTVAKGTPVVVQTTQLVDTSAATVGTTFHGFLAASLIAKGQTAVRAGADVLVELTDVRRTGIFHHSTQVKLALDGISVDGRVYPVQARPITLRPGDMDSASGSGPKKAFVILPNTQLTFVLRAPLTVSVMPDGSSYPSK